MLDIQDLSQLKITKVKPWSIYFNYLGYKYLLHGSSDTYESEIVLYSRNWNGKKYELEYLEGYLSNSDNVERKFIKYKHKGKVYSQIDKKKFVMLLEYKGLCKSCLSKQVEICKNKIKENEKQIDKLNKKARELLKENNRIKETMEYCVSNLQ